MEKVIFFVLFTFTLSLFAAKSEGPMEVWGKDADLFYPQKEQLAQKKSMPIKISQSMIRFFQVYISPIDGPRSSYAPTSSQYTLQAIGKYGFLKGVALGCDRLMRENGNLWVYETKEFDGIKRKLDPVR